MINIAPYIDYLLGNEIDSKSALELLKGDKKLESPEKNLIYAYCYPRQLLDRELPQRIQSYRNSQSIPRKGEISGVLGETILILEAGKTEQYGRFIKHLMYAFCDPEKVFPVETVPENPYDCCICGKTLLDLGNWSTRSESGAKDPNKEYLAYGSKESSVTLCIDCLINLVNAFNLVNEFDPGFLDWTKRKRNKTTLDWSDLKL